MRERFRRRDLLSFKHHAEVAGRGDADELLDWCVKQLPRPKGRVRTIHSARRRVGITKGRPEKVDPGARRGQGLFAGWVRGWGALHPVSMTQRCVARLVPAPPMVCAERPPSMPCKGCD